MPRFETMEEYAEHIRRETCGMIRPLFKALGTDHPTALRVAELCTEAAQIVTGKQMEEEQADVENLDLARLPVPMFASDPDDPYRDE